MLDEHLGIAQANALAHERLRKASPQERFQVSRLMLARETTPEVEVTWLDAWGAPGWKLVVLPFTVARDHGSRLALAVTRWRLTDRQRDVLGALVAGKRNREIAAALGCAERTVELHVTTLLAKAAQGGRTALVSAFWALGEEDH